MNWGEYLKIGALVVSTDGVTALGIISERDIVNAIGARGAAVLVETVDNLMTRDIRTSALRASSTSSKDTCDA